MMGVHLYKKRKSWFGMTKKTYYGEKCLSGFLNFSLTQKLNSKSRKTFSRHTYSETPNFGIVTFQLRTKEVSDLQILEFYEELHTITCNLLLPIPNNSEFFARSTVSRRSDVWGCMFHCIVMVDLQSVLKILITGRLLKITFSWLWFLIISHRQKDRGSIEIIHYNRFFTLQSFYIYKKTICITDGTNLNLGNWEYGNTSFSMCCFCSWISNLFAIYLGF